MRLGRHNVEIGILKDVGDYDAAVIIEGEAEGAIRNGARIVKEDGDPGDSTAVGSMGTVLSSLDCKGIVPESEWRGMEDQFAYFVEWDHAPGIPVFVTGWKIREAR